MIAFGEFRDAPGNYPHAANNSRLDTIHVYNYKAVDRTSSVSQQKREGFLNALPDSVLGVDFLGFDGCAMVAMRVDKFLYEANSIVTKRLSLLHPLDRASDSLE